MDGMEDMMGEMGVWMAVWIVLTIGLVVAGAVWVSRLIRSRKPLTPRADDPREILQRRYAAGEISEDEFFRRISGLDQS